MQTPETAQSLLQHALAKHQAGEIALAEQLYQRVIALDPENIDAMNLLGVLLTASGRTDAAIEQLKRAINLVPDVAELHYNLSTALCATGRHDEAITSLERASELDPGLQQATDGLATLLLETGQPQRALIPASRSVELDPSSATAQYRLGECLRRLDRLDEAIAAYRESTRVDPTRAEVFNSLGVALSSKREFNAAADALTKAITLRPDMADAHNNLGVTLRRAGKFAESVECFHRALAIDPRFASAWNNLGMAEKKRYHMDSAADAYEKAIEFSPEHPSASIALSILQLERGQHDLGLRNMRRTVERSTDAFDHSDLCLMSNYVPGLSGESVLEIHRDWDRKYGYSTPIAPYTNDRTHDRRLRIGFVSPDYRRHPVSYFILPLLKWHDPAQVEAFCYSHTASRDDITEYFRKRATYWREIDQSGDAEVDALIREDKIDILVDLAGHTSGNRMMLFSRKPAPVQVSMIGYPCTTGLRAMDYKISDPHCDPPGTERFYSERLLRLPDSLWCFQPPTDWPDVAALPAQSNRKITFGSVNNFSKVTDEVLDAWAQIIAGVPESEIHIQHSWLTSEFVQRRVYEIFDRHGVARNRLRLTGWSSMEEFAKLIRTFDIGLDPFPFNGGTTTCHLFYDGVPIVALAGERQVSRLGVSMLHAVGLPELIADSTAQYVSKTIALAGDMDTLASIRASLRQRMCTGPLGDGQRYTRDVEEAFRKIWIDWCARPQE